MTMGMAQSYSTLTSGKNRETHVVTIMVTI